MMANEKDKRKVAVKVRNLKQYFNVGKKDEVKAVDDISFDIYEGETLGLVGESGSGKSVTVRSVIQLYAKNAIVTGGKIKFRNQDLLKLSPKEMDKIRGKDISMIFQDPMTSLDPTMPIGKQVAEPLLVHKNADKADAPNREQAVNVLLYKLQFACKTRLRFAENNIKLALFCVGKQSVKFRTLTVRPRVIIVAVNVV